MTDREPILSLQRRNGGTLDFYSFAEIRDTLKEDLANLYLIRNEITEIGEQPSHELNNYLLAYTEITSQAEGLSRKRAVSSISGKKFLEKVVAFFSDGTINSQRFQPDCYHDVEDALKVSDTVMADALLSELLGLKSTIYSEDNDHNNLFKAGLTSTARNDPLYADIYDKIDDLSNRVSSREKQVDRIENEQQARKSDFSRIVDEQSSFMERASKTLEETRNARSALQEKLALKEASIYWKTKSSDHRVRRNWWASGLAVWLAVSIGVLYCSLDHYREHVLKAYSIFDLVPYLPSNILLITLAVWGTRVLIRQVLSELHLATRAEEKETLIQTYLALINEGAADKEDRHLILGPVFSLSQDGLVEDDGLPPHASLISTITGKG